MNLLLALIVFWSFNYFHGKEYTKTTTIGYVEPNSNADSLGFATNDKLLSINGKVVNSWEDIQTDVLINSFGQNLNIEVLRNGIVKTIKVPRSRIPSDERSGQFLIPAGTRPTITEVLTKSPAQQAGIKSGDILVSLNNIPLFNAQQATKIITSHKSMPLPLIVLRDMDTVKLIVTPGSNGMIGVGLGEVFTGQVLHESYGFFESFYYGIKDIIKITELTYQMVGNVIKGKIAFGKAFGGPVIIAKFAAKYADYGIIYFLNFLAMLSLSLAIINILPFPVLDGGHLLIIIIEAIARREIPIKVKVAIQNAGFVILLLLMAFIIYNDISNL
jgi:regulator of sigma E protease